jgi:hypothetical protein
LRIFMLFSVMLCSWWFPRAPNAPRHWHKISFADTQEPDYQEELEECVREGGNIGVVLGPASGLYSIDLDGDALVTDFLALNPCLEKTTRTKGKRGNQFFIRLPPGSQYPNSQAAYAIRDRDGAKCGEWRCGGGGMGAQSIIFGVHPDGVDYQIVVADSPETLEFSSLKWFYPLGQTPQKGPAPKATRQQSAARVRQQTAAAASGKPVQNPQNIYSDLFASFGQPFIKTKGAMVVISRSSPGYGRENVWHFMILPRKIFSLTTLTTGFMNGCVWRKS